MINILEAMSEKVPTPSIQFTEGINVNLIPEIRISRSQDGKMGKALFIFKSPQALSEKFISSVERMRMIDKEGELITREVTISSKKNREDNIEAIYSWKKESDFKRFMRFAERYSHFNNLGCSETEGGK